MERYMFLVRLVYTSEITEGVTESDIQNIQIKHVKRIQHYMSLACYCLAESISFSAWRAQENM